MKFSRLRWRVKKGESRLKREIIVTGATGLIGSRLVALLKEAGFSVIAFVRDLERGRKILGNEATLVYWNFSQPDIEAVESVESVKSVEREWHSYIGKAEGIIHLAGTPIFARRWTGGFKSRIESSRVDGTRRLVEAVLSSSARPSVFISSSAIGIYGNDEENEADEFSSYGDNFLSRVCKSWEVPVLACPLSSLPPFLPAASAPRRAAGGMEPIYAALKDLHPRVFGL